MEYPARQDDKLELVTRFITSIRRIARKLRKAASFSDLRDLYELAEVFQTNEKDQDLFPIRDQLGQAVKHTYRIIAPCGIGGEGPPWPIVLELLHEVDLLAKEVGNAKRALKRRRSSLPHASPLSNFSSPGDPTFPNPRPDSSESTSASQWPGRAQMSDVARLESPVDPNTARCAPMSDTSHAPDHVTALHCRYLPRPDSFVSPSKRKHFDHHDANVGTEYPIPDAQPTFSTFSHGPPPLLTRPDLPRHEALSTTDHASQYFHSSPRSSLSAFPPFPVHLSLAYHSVIRPTYPESRPLPRDSPSPPRPQATESPPVGSRLIPPSRASCGARLSVKDLLRDTSGSAVSSQSPPTSRESRESREPNLPRTAFYEAYTMRQCGRNSGDTSTGTRAGSSPTETPITPRESGDGKWDRPSYPWPRIRQNENNEYDDTKSAAILNGRTLSNKEQPMRQD